MKWGIRGGWNHGLLAQKVRDSRHPGPRLLRKEALTVVVAWREKGEVVRPDFTTLVFVVENLDTAFERVEGFDFSVRVNEVEPTWTRVHA